jgi:elongation factor G
MDAIPGGLQVIQAIVPLAEMLSYATNLKSMTAGQGSFTMELRGYEPVPPNVQQQIVEKYQKSRAGIEDE